MAETLLGIYTDLPMNFPCGSDGKASAYNAGDSGSIPGLGRSPGEGNGNPLQYSCLEYPVHGVSKSRTQLSDFTFLKDKLIQIIVRNTFLILQSPFQI